MDACDCDRRSERGQGTVEWIGLLLVVSLLFAAILALTGTRIPGAPLAKTIAARLVCAVRLSDNCSHAPELIRPYGTEIAALLQDHAPTLLYEEGMTALPVDYRRCRDDGCAAGRGDGAVARSDDGEEVVAFTHVIDCRAGRIRAAESSGTNCSGSRVGKLYLQYWFYYPGSATAEGSTPLKRPIRALSRAVGKPSFHPDDWEGYQVRLGPGARRSARASSHTGYSYELGGGAIPGVRLDRRRVALPRVRSAPRVRNGWGPEVGVLYVSGGSHAGSARIYRRVSRSTKDHRLELIPIESVAGSDSTRFAITPPWRKRVYRDPEYAGTD